MTHTVWARARACTRVHRGRGLIHQAKSSVGRRLSGAHRSSPCRWRMTRMHGLKAVSPLYLCEGYTSAGVSDSSHYCRLLNWERGWCFRWGGSAAGRKYLQRSSMAEQPRAVSFAENCTQENNQIEHQWIQIVFLYETLYHSIYTISQKLRHLLMPLFFI